MGQLKRWMSLLGPGGKFTLGAVSALLLSTRVLKGFFCLFCFFIIHSL